MRALVPAEKREWRRKGRGGGWCEVKDELVVRHRRRRMGRSKRRKRGRGEKKSRIPQSHSGTPLPRPSLISPLRFWREGKGGRTVEYRSPPPTLAPYDPLYAHPWIWAGEVEREGCE